MSRLDIERATLREEIKQLGIDDEVLEFRKPLIVKHEKKSKKKLK
jgi:hypothetical protein